MKMNVNIADLFCHAANPPALAKSAAASVRDMAKMFRWFLKPLLAICPVPVHTDSLVEVVTKMCAGTGTCSVDIPVATTLAMDVRWILTGLRKIRKVWKYAVKGKADAWPKFASGLVDLHWSAWTACARAWLTTLQALLSIVQGEFPEVLELVRMIDEVGRG